MLYKNGIKSEIKVLNPFPEKKEKGKSCIKCSKCGKINCGINLTKCSQCGANL